MKNLILFIVLTLTFGCTMQKTEVRIVYNFEDFSALKPPYICSIVEFNIPESYNDSVYVKWYPFTDDWWEYNKLIECLEEEYPDTVQVDGKIYTNFDTLQPEIADFKLYTLLKPKNKWKI